MRVIETEDDSISLVRKTSVGAMPEKTMIESFSGFNALSNEKGFNIPPIELKVKGPVIQVLPTAIFS